MNPTYVEAQIWWKKAGAGEFSHVHLGGTIPLFMPVSGVLPIEMRIKLHMASGVVNRMEGPGLGYNPGWTGNGEHLLDDFYARYDFPSASAPQNGEQMYQFQATFRDVDLEVLPRRVRIRGAWDLQNGGGKPVSTQTPGTLEAHGWFAPSDSSGRGYTNAVLLRSSVPQGPVKGIWTPRVKFANSGGQSRHGFVSLNPNVHAGNFGTVLFEGRSLSPSAVTTVTVDTTKLPNGSHKLFIKASDEGMFPSGDMETVLVVGFTVEN